MIISRKFYEKNREAVDAILNTPIVMAKNNYTKEELIAEIESHKADIEHWKEMYAISQDRIKILNDTIEVMGSTITNQRATDHAVRRATIGSNIALAMSIIVVLIQILMQSSL